jgi:hypothetical protein
MVIVRLRKVLSFAVDDLEGAATVNQQSVRSISNVSTFEK